jgi:hypothetical protein
MIFRAAPRQIALAAAVAFSLPATLRAEALDEFVTQPGLWQTARSGFVDTQRPLGFRWLSADEDAAQTTARELTLFSLPVNQVTIRFKNDLPDNVTVLFYNRGDAGELSREKFEALLQQAVDALSSRTGAKPTVRGKDASNAVKAEGVWWQSAATRFLLEYSFTREVKSRNIPFRAEFVRLELTPAVTGKPALGTPAAAATPARFVGRDHVKKDPSGDVMIEGVPMVDQGQKGYCVVAATERVMRYYGSQVDEHELAQIANTSSEKGTSNDAMIDALKKLTSRLRIRVRTLEETDVKSILDLIADYNRQAKRGNRAEPIEIEGHTIDIKAVYASMKPDILREVRTRNPSAPSRFMRRVQEEIDGGTPLLWSVVMGIVPETKAPQGFGGHMRLIIGYNAKNNEILYSDSWGLGHELKRMPLADAWTITTGLSKIEPL